MKKLNRKSKKKTSGVPDTPQVEFVVESSDGLPGQIPCLLKLQGCDAGVVFGERVDAGERTGLRFEFAWRDCVNPSVMATLQDEEVLSVSLAAIGGTGLVWELGEVARRTIESHLQYELASAADIVIETVKRLRHEKLPVEPKRVASDVTLVAFYLPQFHQVVENDVWWGTGFTEWTNVAAARPRFRGHQQPRLPGELGFYDLRVPDTLREQIRLAREYGVGAFCFYHYWFGGRRLLERPLAQLLANPELDMPFCICWANEPWTRRWDGLESEVLLAQPHTPEADSRFILDVIPILKDPRYLRVNGKPLLLVYRVPLLANATRTTALWRQICRDHGVGEIELAAVESFGFGQPQDYSFDSSVEFPPHGGNLPDMEVDAVDDGSPFEGKVYSYTEARSIYCNQLPKPWRRYRGVMPNWDNTPRRGNKGHAFHGASPEQYAVWLSAALADTRERLEEGERLVFINAWNEWGEGAVLEPERMHGRRYLEATRDALLGAVDWRLQLDVLKANAKTASDAGLLSMLAAQLEAYERSLRYLSSRSGDQLRRTAKAMPFAPVGFSGRTVQHDAIGCVDKLGVVEHPAHVQVDKRFPTHVKGWIMATGCVLEAGKLLRFVMIHIASRQSYFAPMHHRYPRPDLADALENVDPRDTEAAGFEGYVDCSELPDGAYAISLLVPSGDAWKLALTAVQIQLHS